MNDKILYTPSIKRFPLYLRLAERAYDAGKEYISGTIMATELGLESIQVRKDLSLTRIEGIPRRGFPVAALIIAIKDYLGWNKTRYGAIVGVGHLGYALLHYSNFSQYNFHIVCGFDVDPQIIDPNHNEKPIYHINDIRTICQEKNIDILLLSVSMTAAQEPELITHLNESGAQVVWNFTATNLKLNNMIIQDEGLFSSFALITVKMNQYAQSL